MKKVRITVKKIARYEDLMAEYENLIEHACYATNVIAYYYWSIFVMTR